MGWLSYLFLGDLGQQFELNNQKEELEQLKYQLRERRAGGSDVAELQQENDRLKLTVMALSQLLITKRVITKPELDAMVRHVDGLDGEIDGRAS